MKKYAMSLAEVLTAMIMVATLSVVGMNTLKTFLHKDNDVMKFKHQFGTVSEVIYALKNDSIMYPDGLQNTTTYKYPGEEKSYGGTEKFRKLFKSKFNVMEDNINVSLSSCFPLYIENGTYKSETSIKCFIDNKGFTFCPPSTPTSGKLESLFIPVYFNKVDTTKSNTLGVDKAVFIQVFRNGKIDVPITVQCDSSRKIIDCTNKNYNNYNHCKALDKMTDMNF